MFVLISQTKNASQSKLCLLDRDVDRSRSFAIKHTNQIRHKRLCDVYYSTSHSCWVSEVLQFGAMLNAMNSRQHLIN